ncbi:MAG: hypothetical protein JSS07_05500 [Proteobacteria bacterium]|nr:hypothetical protein [Pseudomonadota bacterium]
MSKKGVSALDKTPSWLQVLINPSILEQHRALQRKELALQKEKLRMLNMKSVNTSSQENLFSLKQLGGHYQCIIIKDNFPKGTELQWIQTIKSIDYKNKKNQMSQENILREIENIQPAKAKETIEKVIQEDTKDQKVHEKREINREGFSTYVFNSLENSPSKSIIIQLVNSKNDTAPLALVQLETHDLWLHDPKLKCSLFFKNTDIVGFKDFLINHVQTNHKEFNQVSIIQLGNKEKHHLERKSTHQNVDKTIPIKRQEILKQPQLQQTPKMQEVQSEQNSKPSKPKHK